MVTEWKCLNMINNNSFLSPLLNYVACLALCVLLGGCLAERNNVVPIQSADNSPEIAETVETAETVSSEYSDVVAIDGDKVDTEPAVAQREIIYDGKGDFINTQVKSATLPDVDVADEDEFVLNFQKTSIEEFVKVVLGDLLKLNYVIDPKVTGTVSMNTTVPLTKERLFPLLEELLSINNATIIDAHDYYKIIPKQDAQKGGISPTTAKDKYGYSVRIVPLEYIAVREMQKILEPFIPNGANARIDKQRNMMILGGTLNDLSVMQETIDVFDVDWLQGMSVSLYALDYVEPKVVKAEIDNILSQFEEGTSNALLGGIVKTVVIERLNSLLLVSATPAGMREAEMWLRQLDRPGEQIGQRLYVYPLQNAKAVEIAGILHQVFNDAQQNNRVAPELAPGTSPVTINSVDEPLPQGEPGVGGELPIIHNQADVGGGISISGSRKLRIIADDTRNALVVLATPQDYKMLTQAIRKLDVVPLQVLIEASILEVNLDGELRYGVEWFFKNSHRSKSGQGSLDILGNSAGVAAFRPSFSYSIIDSANDVRLALSAVASDSQIKILSSPSLMVLDNNTAMINVGDEIPVPTRQSVSNVDPNAPTVNEVQFRSTGIKLEVTPRVNNSGLVIMDISQEVSNAVENTLSSIGAPTIQQRQISSTVAINSGQTVVLGGLMRDTVTDLESGLPVLYQLPVIGKLFGQTSKEDNRTELIVLITPTVIRDAGDARDATEELRRKLQSIPAEDQSSPGPN